MIIPPKLMLNYCNKLFEKRKSKKYRSKQKLR